MGFKWWKDHETFGIKYWVDMGYIFNYIYNYIYIKIYIYIFGDRDKSDMI
jgi:hypothetical protein